MENHKPFYTYAYVKLIKEYKLEKLGLTQRIHTNELKVYVIVEKC